MAKRSKSLFSESVRMLENGFSLRSFSAVAKLIAHMIDQCINEAQNASFSTKIFCEGKQPALVDLPVLVVFWNRPLVLEKTLGALLEAKPSIILLYQNAPSPDFDSERRANYQQAYSVVGAFLSRIDWACKVCIWRCQNYFGIWNSLFRAQKWAFSLCDECAVLEEDCQPSRTWFAFAAYLLSFYKDSNKVGFIYSEINSEYAGDYYKDYDYIFSMTGSVHGWATWKNNFDRWDLSYSWLQNPEDMEKLQKYYGRKRFKKIVKMSKNLQFQKQPRWEVYMSEFQGINNLVNIIPTRNMLHNNGVVGTNSGDGQNLSKKMKAFYGKKVFDVAFPLRGPESVFIDKKVDRKLEKAVEHSSFGKIDAGISLIFSGNFRKLFSKIFKKKDSGSLE